MDSTINIPQEVNRISQEKKNDKSRYSYDDIIFYSDGSSQLESRDLILINQDNTDKFYRVEAGFENRLDLISWKFYDSPLYWWVIAIASNIDDPFDVQVGTLLRIPTLGRALREVRK